MRKKNILLNLLVLLLLFIAYRSIVGWGTDDSTWTAYRNYVCFCRLAVPADWVIDQEPEAFPGGDFGIFEFRHPQLLTSKYVRIYYLNEADMTEAKAEAWVREMLLYLEAENIEAQGEVTVGAAGFPAGVLAYTRGSWEGQMVFLVDGPSAYAIDLEARNFEKNRGELFQILNTFETLE